MEFHDSVATGGSDLKQIIDSAQEFIQQEKYDTAVQLLDKVQSLKLFNGSDANVELKVQLVGLLAESYMGLHDFEKAYNYAVKATEMAKEYVGPSSGEFGYQQILMVGILSHLHKFEEAYDKAIEVIKVVAMEEVVLNDWMIWLHVLIEIGLSLEDAQPGLVSFFNQVVFPKVDSYLEINLDKITEDEISELKIWFDVVVDEILAKHHIEFCLTIQNYAIKLLKKFRGTRWHYDIEVCVDKQSALLQMKGDLNGAIQSKRNAMTICKQLTGEVSKSYSIHLHELGDILMQAEKLEEARYTIEQALKVKESVFGKKDEEYILSIGQLVAVYVALEQFDDALKLQEGAIEQTIALYGEDDIKYAFELHNKAIIYLHSNKKEEANTFGIHAKKIAEKYVETHDDDENAKGTLELFRETWSNAE